MIFEQYERHNQAIAFASIMHRPYSTIRFANNGSFELDRQFYWSGHAAYNQ